MTSGRIARWPEWTRLDPAHKPLLDSLAQPDPYCDWTFVTLWSWDTEEAVCLARLGNGMAMRLPSYPLGGPDDFSFNGRLDAGAIGAFVAEHREVSLVPKPVVEGQHLSDCRVVDDRDQYDYVYDVAESLEMAGGRFRAARDQLRKSRKRNPRAVVRELDLGDPGVVRAVVALFDDWARGRAADAAVERRALVRCLEITQFVGLRCAAVTGPDGLLAFALLAPQGDGWAVSPFAKGHPDHPDVGALLWRSVLETSVARRLRWLNYEQDLGMAGLRQHKLSRRPVRMLEKVRVVPAAAG